MLNYTSEDKLFDALALTKVTDKSQLKVGDRVKVKYSGWVVEYDTKTIIRDGKEFTLSRVAVKKTKVEGFYNGTIVKDYNLAIKLDDGTIDKFSSGKLKNFKKGWDGTPGVGASWGGTGYGDAFLTNGCKIVGKY